MELEYDIVVLGDICLDWHCSDALSFPFGYLSGGRDLWLPIKELPGGSGLLFASFAQEIGYKPFLLGKIGEDVAGRYIHEWLENRGLSTGVTVASASRTGRVFIVNDSEGKRFLLAADESADKWLSVSDIQSHADVIRGTRLLYVSGHCFKEPSSPRVKAALSAIEIARQSGSSIAFDLVPHEFYKIYPTFAQFQSLTNGVDILISEVSSIRRILGMGEQYEEITKLMIEDTIDNVSRYFESVILRYGPHGTDFQAIWKRSSQQIIWEETGYMKAQDKRGYGDRLTLSVLHDMWKI